MHLSQGVTFYGTADAQAWLADQSHPVRVTTDGPFGEIQ